MLGIFAWHLRAIITSSCRIITLWSLYCLQRIYSLVTWVLGLRFDTKLFFLRRSFYLWEVFWSMRSISKCILWIRWLCIWMFRYRFYWALPTLFFGFFYIYILPLIHFLTNSWYSCFFIYILLKGILPFIWFILIIFTRLSLKFFIFF